MRMPQYKHTNFRPEETETVNFESEWATRNLISAVTAVKCGAKERSVSRQFNVPSEQLRTYLLVFFSFHSPSK